MARLPIILDHYLEDTEQKVRAKTESPNGKLSESHLLMEAEWCLYNASGNEASAAHEYTAARKRSLQNYVNRLKAKGVEPKHDFDL